MATENNTILNKEQIEMLVRIAEATKRDSFTYEVAEFYAPLLSNGFIEVNAEIKGFGGAIATRALPEGIKFATLVQWEEAKETLAFAKERELILRNEVVALFSDADQKKGTENVLLDDGAKLKIVKKLSYNLKAELEEVENALDKIEALGPQYEIIASRLVKWKAELSVSEYNKLDDTEGGDKIKKIIDEVIIIKEATPTVELVEPKAKK